MSGFEEYPQHHLSLLSIETTHVKLYCTSQKLNGCCASVIMSNIHPKLIHLRKTNKQNFLSI